MLAVFSQADALIIVAIITSAFGAVQSILNGRKLKTNGGTSPVDTMNRTESKVDEMRVDLKAVAADVRDLHVRVNDLEEAFTNPPTSGHVRRKESA